MTTTLPARYAALNSLGFQASALPDAIISVWLFMVLSLFSLISILGAVEWDLVQWLRSKKIAERRSLCSFDRCKSGHGSLRLSARQCPMKRRQARWDFADVNIMKMSFLTLTRLETKHGQSVRL